MWLFEGRSLPSFQLILFGLHSEQQLVFFFAQFFQFITSFVEFFFTQLIEPIIKSIVEQCFQFIEQCLQQFVEPVIKSIVE